MLNSACFQGQKYVIVGFGLSGQSAYHMLKKSQADVTIFDDSSVVRDLGPSKGLIIFDPLKDDLPQDVSAVILSPGIAHHFPTPHPLAKQAQARGIPLICDVELLLKSQPQATYVVITGTNGKSTTTTLLGHLINCAQRSSAIGGNIGIPVGNLPTLGTNGIYVLELSSYQLELVPSLKADIAIMTNISPDHIARHGTMDGYIQAKNRIWHAQGQAQTSIISMDDTFCQNIYQTLVSDSCRQTIAVSVTQTLDHGIYVQNGWLIDDFFERGQRVYNLQQLKNLKGRHNWQNILCAYAACRKLGLSMDEIIQYLPTFQGLAHRLQRIGSINAVEFINDSKATNPQSTFHALAAYDTIFWIVGGQAKESELDGLEPFFAKVKCAYLIGHSTPRFTEILQGKVPYKVCGTVDAAVRAAFQDANREQQGTVLLSPACASWDQFQNFEARGHAFCDAVAKLKL